MTILYFHQHFKTPTMQGGTRSFEMARRLVADGHVVHLITSDQGESAAPGYRVSVESGIIVHWLRVPYANEMGFWRRVLAFLEFGFLATRRAMNLDGDLVFATSTPLTIILPAIMAAWRRRLPLVFEVRDLWPELPIAVGAVKHPILKLLARWLERFSYTNAERVIVLSPGMRTGVEKTGYPAERIAVIPNSSDINLFEVGPETGTAFRERYSWLGDRPLVVYTGTFGEINGVEYLARLAGRVLRLDPEIRFLLVGSGKMKHQVALVAHEEGVLNRSLFVVDGMPKREIPAVLSAATIVTSVFVNLQPMWANSANKFFDGLAASRPLAINYGGWQADLLVASGAGVVLPHDDLDASASLLVARIRDEAWLDSARRAAGQLARQKFARDTLAREFERELAAARVDWDRGARYRKPALPALLRSLNRA